MEEFGGLWEWPQDVHYFFLVSSLELAGRGTSAWNVQQADTNRSPWGRAYSFIGATGT